MRVQELIEELQRMRPDMPVLVYMESSDCSHCGGIAGWHPVGAVRMDNVDGSAATLVVDIE